MPTPSASSSCPAPHHPHPPVEAFSSGKSLLPPTQSVTLRSKLNLSTWSGKVPGHARADQEWLKKTLRDIDIDLNDADTHTLSSILKRLDVVVADAVDEHDLPDKIVKVVGAEAFELLR